MYRVFQSPVPDASRTPKALRGPAQAPPEALEGLAWSQEANEGFLKGVRALKYCKNQ